jgi:IS30 family transposase
MPDICIVESRLKLNRDRRSDWEVDTIIGKGHRQAIVTLMERKSRFSILRKADLVSAEVIDLLQPVADCLHTITGDNGKEFAENERIAQELEVSFIFAHSYAAWERGANEYMNGLVRQNIPKNRDLLSVTDEELLLIMNKLNHRPRNCLDFKTPFEVFF